jgi:hypothetical protein
VSSGRAACRFRHPAHSRRHRARGELFRCAQVSQAHRSNKQIQGFVAGTCRRGKTPDEDAALKKELLADPKERAEHVMLVELARNGLPRIFSPNFRTTTPEK